MPTRKPRFPHLAHPEKTVDMLVKLRVTDTDRLAASFQHHNFRYLIDSCLRLYSKG